MKIIVTWINTEELWSHFQTNKTLLIVIKCIPSCLPKTVFTEILFTHQCWTQSIFGDTVYLCWRNIIWDDFFGDPYRRNSNKTRLNSGTYFFKNKLFAPSVTNWNKLLCHKRKDKDRRYFTTVIHYMTSDKFFNSMAVFFFVPVLFILWSQ